jgi:hypothetical protein
VLVHEGVADAADVAIDAAIIVEHVEEVGTTGQSARIARSQSLKVLLFQLAAPFVERLLGSEKSLRRISVAPRKKSRCDLEPLVDSLVKLPKDV